MESQTRFPFDPPRPRRRFARTGGWGYARWLGAERKPFGKDASFEQECFACHTPVKANDYVFTKPVRIP